MAVGPGNRKLAVVDAKAAKLADDLLAFVPSKAAASKPDGSDEHDAAVKSGR